MPDAITSFAVPEGLPPGPADLPAQQARMWIERTGDLLDRCRAEHGDLFTLRLGELGPMVIVADPQGVAQVFDLPDDAFECRQFNASYRYVMGDRALFLQDGDAHRRLKRTVAPSFLPGALAGHADAVRDIAARAVAGWADGPLRLRPDLHGLALECLLHLVFGGADPRIGEIKAMFEAIVWKDMRAWKPWTAMSRLRPKITALIDAELDRLRGGGAPVGPASLLAALLAGGERAGVSLDNAEIHDQVMMLLITAVDALGVSASWALYRVAADPAAQDRIRDERATADVQSGRDIADLPYISAAMREVLRLHPVLATVSGRCLTREQMFMGFRIPAGVTLTPCQYLVHRRGDLFDEPLAFRPERFLGRGYPAHHYFPFGGSGRACLGSSLAPMTAKILLSETLMRLRLRTVAAVEPVTVRHGTLLAPDESLSLLVERL